MSTTYPLPKSTRQQDFVATASQTVFGPVSFLCFDVADIVVQRRAVGDTAFTTLTTGWTAMLSPSPIGYVTVTFSVGRTAGETIRISSRRVHDRSSDVTRAGAVRTSLLEIELDKAAAVLQELRRDVSESLDTASLALSQIAAAIAGLVPPGTITGLMLSSTAIQDRLGFFPVSPDDLTDATTFHRTDIASPAYIANHIKMSQRADMRDWDGLDLTGANGEAPLVTAMLSEMSGKGVLHRPPGIVALDMEIPFPSNVWIKGVEQADGQYTDKAGFFHITHGGVGFRPTDNVGSRAITECNFYRTQPTPGPGFVPNNHDFDIDLEGAQGWVLRNNTHLNPSRMINVRGRQSTGATCGRIYLDNIKGQPLIEGIRATHCTDVFRMRGLHLWPVWNADPNVIAYTRNNAAGTIFGRMDNMKLGVDNFVWGYQRGMIVNNQPALGTLPTGTVNLATIAAFGFDNCGVPVLINTGSDGAALYFGSVYGASDPAQPSISTESLFWCLGNNSRVSIMDLFGQYTNGALIALDGTGNNWTVGRSRSKFIDNDAGGTAEFSVGAGNILRLLSAPETSAGTIYGGAGTIETPDWRAFTPAITSSGGAFGSFTSNVGRYRRQGKTVKLSGRFQVNALGAASGELRVTNAPFTVGTQSMNGSFRRDSDGRQGNLIADNGGTLVRGNLYDGTFPAPAGAVIVWEIEYEAV